MTHGTNEMRAWGAVRVEMLGRLVDVSDGVYCREQSDPLMVEAVAHYEAQKAELDALRARVAELEGVCAVLMARSFPRADAPIEKGE